MRHILKHKKALLFDLDGTLVDSMWMWKRIDMEFLGTYGQECPPGLEREIEGMSFSETALYFKERFHLPLTLDEIKAQWNRNQQWPRYGGCGVKIPAYGALFSGGGHSLPGEGGEAGAGHLPESGRRAGSKSQGLSGV